MERFELVGHDCIFGRYPSPVIPVGKLRGALVAVYPGGDAGPTLERIPMASEFVRYPPELRKRMVGFDWKNDRLFAYSTTRVEYYPAIEERDFLSHFLKSSDSRKLTPSIRRMLVKATRQQDLIGKLA